MGAIDTFENVGVAQNFKRIATGIPVNGLLKRIADQPELWGEITSRQEAPGSSHHDTEAIFLRWCKGQTVEDAFYSIPAIDYPAAAKLMPEVSEPFKALLDAIGEYGEIGRVMIVKLKAGGSIDEHVDEGAYAEHYDRFHVVLSSNSGNEFVVDSHAFRSQPGEAWWFNHKKPHYVANRSNADRIHMIVDVVAPKFRAMRGTYFQQELFVDCYHEAAPLLEAHWREIAHYQDIMLEPDEHRYIDLEISGKLRIYTARVAGELVGYAAFFVAPNMHYKSSVQAVQDVIFLAPRHRNSRIGLKLLSFSEDRLRAEGVQAVHHHVKTAHPALGRILGRMGYKPVDVIYSKRLDRKGS